VSIAFLDALTPLLRIAVVVSFARSFFLFLGGSRGNARLLTIPSRRRPLSFSSHTFFSLYGRRCAFPRSSFFPAFRKLKTLLAMTTPRTTLFPLRGWIVSSPLCLSESSDSMSPSPACGGTFLSRHRKGPWPPLQLSFRPYWNITVFFFAKTPQRYTRGTRGANSSLFGPTFFFPPPCYRYSAVQGAFLLKP